MGVMRKYKSNEYRSDTLVPNKVNIKAKEITRDEGGSYIMKKGSIHGNIIGIVIVYATKNRAEKHVHQQVIKLEGETDKSTMILMTSTPLSQQPRRELGKKKSARIYVLFKCP